VSRLPLETLLRRVDQIFFWGAAFDCLVVAVVVPLELKDCIFGA
jgi:hypothetical protein